MLNNPLRQVSLFEGLDETALDTLSSKTITRSYPKNAILINEGDLSDSMYLILSGRVKVYAGDEDGHEMLINSLGSGDYFGELALLDEHPRSASVMTLEPSKMMILSRAVFLECLDAHPSMSRSLLRVLARKVRQQTDHTKSIVLSSVYERLVNLLHALGKPRNGKIVLENTTQKYLAERVFASREMVSMIFSELKQGGYISTDRRCITIEKKLPEK